MGDELLVAVGRRAEHRRRRARDGRPRAGRAARGRRAAAGARRGRGSGSTRWATWPGSRSSPTWASTRARLAGDVIAGRDVVDEADAPRGAEGHVHRPAGGGGRATEAEARDAGIDVRVVRTAPAGWRAPTCAATTSHGTSQLVVDEARRVVVGATFTGPDVQEMLHAATIAIVGEVPLERLWHAVPAFPTVSEVWLRLLEAVRAVACNDRVRHPHRDLDVLRGRPRRRGAGVGVRHPRQARRQRAGGGVRRDRRGGAARRRSPSVRARRRHRRRRPPTARGCCSRASSAPASC